MHGCTKNLIAKAYKCMYIQTLNVIITPTRRLIENLVRDFNLVGVVMSRDTNLLK